MSDPKVNRDTAEEEFDRFADLMDLDFDESKMNDEDKKSLREARDVFVKNVMSGHLVVDEKGQPVYTTRSTGEQITFYEPNGAAFMAMDSKKKNEDVGKQFALLGAMTKLDRQKFATMPNRDLRVCNTIMLLFLG